MRKTNLGDRFSDLSDELRETLEALPDLGSFPEPAAAAGTAPVRHDAVGPTAAADLDLQRQLAEKDQLIAALTERLEQAAEQLDRARRLGPDGVSAALPDELIVDQQALLEELRLAVQQWQDLQAAAALGRIEMQLGEIRDLVASRPAMPSTEPVSTPAGTLAEALAGLRGPSVPANSSAEPSNLTWEQQKARLLGGDAREDSESGKASSGADASSVIEPLLRSRPAPVDLGEQDPRILREAIDLREEYIDRLAAHLRASREPSRFAGTLPRFEELPEKEREVLEAWRDRIHDELRQAEVDLSLERARVSRERLNLKCEMEQLRQKREAGVSSAAPAPAADSAAAPSGSNRWMRIFGGK